MSGLVVVAGSTGFVGRHVVAQLLAQGFTVRAGTRSPQRARDREPHIDWVRLDVDDEQSLDEALEGADALVYLVHHMRSHDGDLLSQERASARRVRTVAERAGVRRIVYLGGPRPQGAISEHLAARLETGRVLRAGTVSTIELQAAMIIGVGSESWLIVRDLAMRLPCMVLPAWLERRSEPVGIEDVASAIVRCVSLHEASSCCLPLPGPEALSAKRILLRVAAAAKRRPVMLPVPVLSPHLSSHWIRWVTRADYEVARQLVDGLTSDLVAQGETFWTRCPDRVPTPIDTVIRRTLAAESEEDMPPWQHRWERWAGRVSRGAKEG